MTGPGSAEPTPSGEPPDATAAGGAQEPDPSARPCVDCGHVWFEGERRHELVTGPPPPGFRRGRVEVVCVLCRRQRERRGSGGG
jgi:hypothetical protein